MLATVCLWMWQMCVIKQRYGCTMYHAIWMCMLYGISYVFSLVKFMLDQPETSKFITQISVFLDQLFRSFDFNGDVGLNTSNIHGELMLLSCQFRDSNVENLPLLGV